MRNINKTFLPFDCCWENTICLETNGTTDCLVNIKIVKTLKEVDKKIKEDPGIMGTGDPQRKFKKSKSPEIDEPMKPMKKGGLVKKKK